MSDPFPTGWERTTLGELGEFSTSSVDKKRVASERPVRLLNYMDVYRNSYLDSSMEFMEVTATLQEWTKARVEKGDMFFTPSSETPDDIGHSAVFVDDPVDLLHSYHTVRYRIYDPDRIDIRYRGRVANSGSVLKHFSLLATGSTRHTLSLSDFRSAPISLPPSEEQKAVAEILDVLDTAILETEAIIAKLKAVKKGLLHDLLTRGIDANGELRPPQSEAPHLYKPSPLGWIPKEWDACELNSLVDPARPVVYGILMPGHGYLGGVPVVKVKDISDDGIDLDGLLLTSPQIDREYSRSRLRAGDLLFTIRGTVGRMALVPDQLEGANITQDTARLSIKFTDARFVRACLAVGVSSRFIAVNTLGVAVQGINLRDVRRIPLPRPKDDEATEIGCRLDSANQRVKDEVLELEKLKLVKAGLMDDLLTGRVRVTPLLEG